MATQTEAPELAPCCGLEVDAHAAEPDPTLADTAALFKALSDPTRLRIVRTMSHSKTDLCECNIVPLFGLSQSTISYHLKVLREAGIVECEKRGLWSYCRVNNRVLMAAVKALAEL